MKSLPSEFKLFNRGAKETTVLIPGWATDYRIFSALDLDFNYLIPIKFSPYGFQKWLLSSLKDNGLNKISILGWSMGGFIAWDFASKYQDMINNLTLISIRENYEKESIEKIKTYLKNNRKGYLYRFYRDFFSKKEEEDFSWFKRHLLRSYLKEMELDLLLEGLDYLSQARLSPLKLKRVKIKFIHGQEDRIVPIEEMLKIKESFPAAEFMAIDGKGHIPFLSPDFKRIFYGMQDR